MRRLRALVHAILALALIGAGAVPARAAAFTAGAAAELGSSVQLPATSVHAGHAGHDDEMPASEHPTHKQDACQTSCCFIPSQLASRAPNPSSVEFRAVHYLLTAQPASGRDVAPEPGIPKHVG